MVAISRRTRPRSSAPNAATANLHGRGLTVRYGNFTALSEVDLELAAASVHAVIGPNGAGKSTLAGAICGEVPLAAGHIVLGGADVTRAPSWRRARHGLGRTYQVAQVYDTLSVAENLTAAGPRIAPGAVERSLDVIGMSELAASRAGSLSSADRKRLEIGMLIAQGASVLVLDEPAAGMGASETTMLAELLAQLRRDGCAMLLIEHDLDLVLGIADRVTVLNFGKVIFSGSVQAMLTDTLVRDVYLHNTLTDESETNMSAAQARSRP